MGVDFSAVLMYGVVLDENETSQIYKTREIEHDGFTEFDEIYDRLEQKDLTLLMNDCYYEIPDRLVLGQVLEETEGIEIVSPDKFLESNPNLAQKIYDTYEELFNRELEPERLNFVLVERIW